MGRYDWTAELNGEYRLTITDLCQAISEETYGPDEPTVRQQLYGDHKRDGLLAILRRHGLNPIQIAGNQKEEKFQAFKLVKLIYELVYSDPGIGQLLKFEEIFSKPKLRLLLDEKNSELSAQEKIFQKLYRTLANDIDNYEKIKNVYHRIHREWEDLIKNIIGLVFSKEFLCEVDTTITILPELKDISCALQEVSICNNSESQKDNNNGVMETMLLQLLITEIKCYLAGQRTIVLENYNQEYERDQDLLERLNEKIIAVKNDTITWEDVSLMRKLLLGETTGIELEKGVRLAAYLNIILVPAVPKEADITVEKLIKPVKDIFHHFDVLVKIIDEQYSLSFNEEIPFLFLAGCIQTISIVNREKMKYYDNYLEHTTRRDSLMASLEDESIPESAALSWMYRVANRIILLLGGRELASAFQKIILAIYKIEEIVFQYPSLPKIEKVHEEYYERAVEICNRFSVALWYGMEGRDQTG